MLQELKKNVHDNKITGSIVMDLSKVFRKINHDPLIEKFPGYCFSDTAIQLEAKREYLQ